jgi:hypothetical protein
VSGSWDSFLRRVTDDRKRSLRCSLPVLFTAMLLLGSFTGQARLKTIDLFPIFFRCFEAFPTNPSERARSFAESLVKPHPEIFRRPEVFKTDPVSLKEYLDQAAVYLSAIKRIHARFLNESGPIEESFYAQFSDFNRARVEIFLTPSLFRFDAKIPHDNPRALFLGLDGLAKFHGINAHLGVILSHELFHLYHFQVNALPADIEQIPLYRQIWQEGLATYVSAFLNPKATLAEILLDPQLADDGPKYLAKMAGASLPQLESTDDQTTAFYLSYRRESKTPSRIGYLIGYEIARHLALTKSLKELSRLRGRRLLKIMRTEVRAMAADDRRTNS